MSTTQTRDDIHAAFRIILAETRGCEEDECKLEATLFGDLELESIDFLEISFRIEEPWGFSYPTDELGEIMNSIDEGSTTEDIEQAIGRLREEFFMDVPENLPGVEPFDARAIAEAIRNLFTVGHLVTFVERRLAKADPSTT